MYGDFQNTAVGVHPAYGHSKDHRADLKQILITSFVNREGVPLFGTVASGNRSDKTLNGDMIDRLTAALDPNQLQQLVYVVDSALVTRANLTRLVDRLIEEGLLALRERVALLKAALHDRHLFEGIEESGTDSVFRRSFSVLVMPMVLGPDLGAGELPEDLVVWTLGRPGIRTGGAGSTGGVSTTWRTRGGRTADALAMGGRHPRTPVTRVPDVLFAIHDLATLTILKPFGRASRTAVACFVNLEEMQRRLRLAPVALNALALTVAHTGTEVNPVSWALRPPPF